MYMIKAAMLILGMLVLAGLAVFHVEQFIKELARTETVSNFLKNDWTTCDGVYYPESAHQTNFEL